PSDGAAPRLAAARAVDRRGLCRMTVAFRRVGPVVADEPARPVVGVMCCNQFVDERDAQVVSSRFITPLTGIAGLSVLLVPGIADAASGLAGRLGALLLTGCGWNVCSSC